MMLLCVSADFNTPFQLPTPQAAAPASVDEPEPSAELIESVMAMGFERFQAVKALKATVGSVVGCDGPTGCHHLSQACWVVSLVGSS